MLFDRAHKFLGVALLAIDFLMLVLAFGLAYWLRVQYDARPLLTTVEKMDYIWSVMMIIPVWIVVFFSLGLYRARVYLKHGVELARVVWGCFLGILLVIGMEYVTNHPVFPARLVMIYVLVMSMVLVFGAREIVQWLVRRAVYKRYGAERVVVVGDSEVATSFIERVAEEGGRIMKVVAYVGPKKYLPKGAEVKQYEDLAEIDRILQRHRAQGVIQTGLYGGLQGNRQVLNAAERAHIQYCFIPGEPEFYSRTNAIGEFLQFPVVTVSQTPLFGIRATVKRLVDIFLVILATPLWGPVFLVTCLLQKIFNPGPVFFKQKRLGKHGKRIDIYKFRSMWQKYSGQDAIKIFESMGLHELAEQYAKTRKIDHDPRVAGWWGKFLRWSSLDEVPQLINVLRGDMSLVGPRPILEDELEFYKTKAPLLLSVTPGLTGLASVSGRSELLFAERVNLELYYAGNWSFMMDARILWQTAGVVLGGKGAK
jgi:exopolysaccharide biosynthesis polyprenyl glycosylphosphotransferase